MKIQYVSEIDGKVYDSVQALEKAEAAHKAEDERKSKLKAEREARAKEVEAAFKKASAAEEEANKLLREFIKDYGSFHTTLKDSTVFPLLDNKKTLFDLFF